MLQQALRTVLLIKAIEETDRLGEVIPLADRIDASRAALRESPPSGASAGAPLAAESERFLVLRAEHLLARLRARAPVVVRALTLAGGLSWLGRILLALAFAMGVSLSALDGSRRINVLSFPLIGLIVWNLVVYVVVLAAWLRSLRRRVATVRWTSSLYVRWIGSRLEVLLRRSRHFNAPLAAGLRRFAGEWSAISQPLLWRRAACLMHLAAALVAIGLVAGLYFRGLALRYEAGWESTFLGPRAAHALLMTLYGPAAAISGIPVGSAQQIEQLRWTASGGGAEAASWIHLIALTAALYIVLPRLFAALATALGSWRWSRRAPLPASAMGYARSLAMAVADGSLREAASVMPYAYEPGSGSLAGLELLLSEALGARLSMQLCAPLRYGEEETIGARLQEAAHGSATLPKWNVLVMNLAATPEVENHGALIGGLRDWLAEHATGTPLLVVIDEAAYASRMRGDGAFARRLQERRNLWRDFVAGYGLRACIADLTQIAPGTQAGIDARDAARTALWTAGEAT